MGILQYWKALAAVAGVVVFATAVVFASDKPEQEKKKTTHYDDFIPTYEWQEVGENQAVPGGLEIRMELDTGKKFARKMRNRPGYIPESERQ